MGTPFSEIIDMAMIGIRDYKLDAIFINDPEVFDSIMIGYLLKSVPKFTGCKQSLEYDLDTNTFNSTLDAIEIDILADLVGMTWYIAEIQDVLEFKETLRDSDFNRYSTGQNLKSRQTYLEMMKENYNQHITNYQLIDTSLLPFFKDLVV